MDVTVIIEDSVGSTALLPAPLYFAETFWTHSLLDQSERPVWWIYWQADRFWLCILTPPLISSVSLNLTEPGL